MPEAFDPDKYLSEKTQAAPVSQAQGFNPDQYLAEKGISEPSTEQAPQQQTTTGEASLQGFGNGVSMGYLPQLQALTEKGVDAVFGDNTDDQLRSRGFQLPDDSYVAKRDQFIRKEKVMNQEHPVASFVGNAAGTIAASPVVSAGLGKILGVAAKAVPAVAATEAGTALINGTRAATFTGRLGQAAATGGAIGAIRNPGDTEGELSPLQPVERAKNVATDAATGMIFQGLAEGAGKVGSKIKEAAGDLKSYSQLKALKASGAMLKDFRKAFGNNRANELGQAVIDEGIVGIGDDIGDIAKKAEVAKTEIGNKISSVYDEADKLIGPADKDGISQNGFDLNKMAGEFKKDIADKYKGKAGGNAIVQKVHDVLDEISTNDNVGFKKLKEVRGSIDDLINYSKQNNEMPALQSELKSIRNKIQSSVRERLSVLDEEHGTDLLSEFTKQNKRYSNVAEIAKMAQDKAARETSNASFGMRERLASGSGAVIGGGIGATVAGPVGAAIGAGAGGLASSISTKVARQYGTPYVAITANKVAKVLENNPSILGNFSEPLLKAASVSPKEFVSAINLMLKKPEFKNAIEKIRPEHMDPVMPELANERPGIGRSPTSKFVRKNQ